MDTKKVILYGLGAVAIIYLGKKIYDNQKEIKSFIALKLKAKKPIEKTNAIVDENIELKTITSIKLGDSNDYVLRLKEIINFFYNENVLDETSDYDGFMLEVVQDLFGKQSPALYDYETGEVCVNFIKVMDYIILKSKGHDVSDYEFDTIPDLATCEVVSKSDTGTKVRELQRFINYVRGTEALVVTGNYSGAMRNEVRDVFGDSNVIRKDASAGVCYRFLKSATIMLKNIDKYLQEVQKEVIEQAKEEENV